MTASEVEQGTVDGHLPAPRRVSRRTVLGGAGAIGAGIAATTALAGCGAVGGQPAAAPTQTGPVTLGPTSDIPVGGGKIYPEQLVVVTQPAAGTFKCFSATCTHAGCLLHDVTGGTINCTCHGSQFSIVDGSVTRPPAEQPLPAEQITIAGGQITLT
jgi:Rieske Fe-S protein